MPAMFALGQAVIGDAAVATFAAFGSFAQLLLVDFAGPMRARLQAQAALALAGAVLACLGTLVSGSTWLAAAAMAVVAFGVLFAGVVSSVLAATDTAVRIIWTGDHVDAARRLQGRLVAPARGDRLTRIGSRRPVVHGGGQSWPELVVCVTWRSGWSPPAWRSRCSHRPRRTPHRAAPT